MRARQAAGDLRSERQAGDWIVVGWFTPSYRHWAERLATTLAEVEAPYHLLACQPIGRHWEAETMRKAGIVRRFREAYPDQTLILLDADCVVRRSLEPLARSVKGDVAAFVRAKSRGRGKERARIKVLSGTMVFRPTPGAGSFIEAWLAAQEECDAADVDQTSLMIAMGRATEFTFQPLGAEWCALDASAHADPAIVHDNASREAPRARAPSPRAILGGWVERIRGRAANAWRPRAEAPQRSLARPGRPPIG